MTHRELPLAGGIITDYTVIPQTGRDYKKLGAASKGEKEGVLQTKNCWKHYFQQSLLEFVYLLHLAGFHHIR